MALKSQPWMSAQCWPLTPQRRWSAKAFGISDNLAGLDKGPEQVGHDYSGLGGGAGLGDVTSSTGAGQGGHITETNGLQWLNLWDEEDKTRLAGYRVAARHTPLSGIIEGETGINPPEGTVGLVWTPSGATAGLWSTVLPDREPLHTGIKFGSVNMEHLAGATTALPLPEDQEFRIELQCVGVARSDDDDRQPWLRLTWGGQYSVYLCAGQAARLQELRPTGQHGEHTADNARNLRTLRWAEGFWGYAPVLFDVGYVGGRLVVGTDQASTIYTDRERNADPTRPAKHDEEGTVRHVRAREAPLQVESRGIAFVLRTQETAYSDTEFEAGETEFDAGWARSAADSAAGNFKRKFFASQAPGATGVGGYVRGYFPRRMNVNGIEQSATRVATVAVDANTRSGEQHYTCALEADAPDAELNTVTWREDVRTYKYKAMRGHASPFVHGVVVRSGVTWRAQTTADPVDIRPAILSATESTADPAIQAGPTWNFSVDRNILPDIEHPAGGTLGNDWDEYVGKYHPINVYVGWVYDDGEVRVYSEQGGAVADAMVRLKGYIMSVGPEAPGANQRPLSVDARDPIVRLQRPAGLVDGRFCALDFLMAEKLDAISPDRKSSIYGADCVQYIIGTALDDWAGESLRVYYPGYTGSWPPPDGQRPDQWTLMDYKIWVDPPSGSGMIWPPPFGQSAHDWIRQICDVDFAVFYYQPSPDNSAECVPTYGNYYTIVASTPTTVIPDAHYLTGDDLYLASAADYRDLPESDFNRFVVWGQVPGGDDLGGLMPALPEFSAEYVIEDSTIEEQNARKTWERSSVLKGTQFYLPRVARQVARLQGLMLKSLNVRSTSVRCRGIEWLTWGHKVRLQSGGTEADPALTLTEPDGSLQTFRVMRVRNSWRFEGSPAWDTQLSLAQNMVSNPYD